MKRDLKIELVSQDHILGLREVLLDWLTLEETEYYLQQIKDPAKLYDSHYYAALLKDQVIGVIAYRIPAPKIIRFTISDKPAELNMIYVGKKYRGGKGVGSALLNHIIEELKETDYTELVVRSAEKFKETGWGFYDKMGFSRAGELMPPESETRSKVWNKLI